MTLSEYIQASLLKPAKISQLCALLGWGLRPRGRLVIEEPEARVRPVSWPIYPSTTHEATVEKKRSAAPIQEFRPMLTQLNAVELAAFETILAADGVGTVATTETGHVGSADSYGGGGGDFAGGGASGDYGSGACDVGGSVDSASCSVDTGSF